MATIEAGDEIGKISISMCTPFIEGKNVNTNYGRVEKRIRLRFGLNLPRSSPSLSLILD